MDNYSVFIVIGIVLMIIDYILFNIGMFYLLAKERQNTTKAFIPIINYYEYFKICHIPFITFFIPLVNIVIILASPVRLAKTYRCNKKEIVVSLLLQNIFIIFIGLSDRKNKYNEDPDFTIKSQEDIDNLEAKLVNNANIDEDSEHKENTDTNKDYTKFKVREAELEKQIIKSETVQEQIDVIEEEVVDDQDKPYEDEFTKLIEPDKEENKDVESLDMYDIEDNASQDSLDSIDELEQSKILHAQADDNIDRNEYTEYKEVEKAVDEIAFENNNERNEDHEDENAIIDLKCPRCGTSLEGSNGTCPGCSADVTNIISEHVEK